MIWLALNLWWILPATLLVCALVPVAFGVGIPVIREAAKRVPVIVWQAVGVVAVLSYSADFLIGVGVERCQNAQAAVEAKADAKALTVHKDAQDKAQEVVAGIQKETSDVQSEVRTIIKTVPATCPSQPPRLRELGQQQVEAARRGLLPAPNR